MATNKSAVERDDMLDTETLTACRACSKLMAIATKGWAELEHADSHWDGGEWSGPAWADNWQSAEAAVVKIVADRFGIGTDYLHNVWQYNYQYDNEYCFFEALRKDRTGAARCERTRD